MLDTSICIEIIRGRRISPRGRSQLSKPGRVCMSCISLAELEFGVQKSSNPVKNRVALSKFCSIVQTIPFDDAAAIHYGLVRQELQQAGMLIGPMDLLIGAHARASAVVLVTNNEREFRRIPSLAVENWLK